MLFDGQPIAEMIVPGGEMELGNGGTLIRRFCVAASRVLSPLVSPWNQAYALAYVYS